MPDSIINAKENDKVDVVIVSAPYEKTVSSKKGTKNGPRKIISMLDSKLELFDRTYKRELTDQIKIGQKELGMSFLSPEKALAKITDECGKILENGAFVFLLGGEHSVSLGLLTALANKQTNKINPKEATILHIDAHCDLRNDDSDYSNDPSRLAHSCVMRRAHELGYNLVQVGVRTYFKGEYEYFSDPKNNIKVFEWGLPAQAGKKGGQGKAVPSIDEILASIKTKYVYITIDVDGFDPAHMPGTGTAVQGGLEWWYGVELLERIVDERELIGADIVEVSPMRDTVLTEYGAAQLVYTMLAHKFQGKFK